ncbi:MAG: disulfide bond formation protein DsbA, partial [Burkholderiales bacterium PBB4]
ALPWVRPTAFPRAATLPMKVAAAHADAPWIGRYCRIFMTKLFALDEEINAELQVLEVLTGLGFDAAAVFAHAHSHAGRNSLREHTAQAQARGVFGAPTFFVQGEMFWGNDRLDDALDFAVRTAPGP